MDCIWHGRRLAFRRSWIAELPTDVQAALKGRSGSGYLQMLAELALDPAWTLRISARFEPLLIDFATRWIINEDATGEVDFRAFCAISRTLSVQPQLERHASETSLGRRRGLFQQLGRGGSQRFLTTLPDVVLGPLLLSIFRCLRHDRHTFSPLVYGPQIQALFQHPTKYIKYLAIRVYALFLDAADAAVHRLLNKYGSDDCVYGPWDDREIDYRYLELWEQRLHGLCDEHKSTEVIDSLNEERYKTIESSDLTERTVVIGGSLQPTFSTTAGSDSALIPTTATAINLERLGISLVDRKPILITGIPGSGKSALVREASRVYGKDKSMLTLHLNEQTDAKLLIGMYTSSGSPGSFRWQPGVLTTAVREGRWCLIEDLDRAPAEVMSTLLPLVERRQLYVPNLGGMVKAHSDFRLFATIRSSIKDRNQQDSKLHLSLLGGRNWTIILAEPLAFTDLQVIMTEKYPLLRVWSAKLLIIYEQIIETPGSVRGFDRQTIATRTLGPQDLFKCCRRINQILLDSGAITGSEPTSESTQDHIFLEIVDCFVGFTHSAALREHVTITAAQILQMPPQRREHCLRTRVPKREETDKRLRLGRVTLQRRKQQSSGRIDAKVNRPFAYTNDVLRKMEAIAAAVRSREPCLLVGETGTGKTTAVQQLAQVTGKKLVVVNLSQQSEAGDLLGGYKPLSLRSLSMPLKEDFDDLFAETVTVDENEKFLREVNRAFAKSQYVKLLKLWERAIELVKRKMPAPEAHANENPAKRRKLEKPRKLRLRAKWDDFAQKLRVFEMHVKSGGKGFAFHFVEGNIVRAVRNGDWVLLDEINLASPDTLESLADLLTNDSNENPSLILTETGDVARISAHPDFRIFAAMNPATDVGKRDLPLSLRSRFTEFYMNSPDRDPQSLLQIVKTCLGAHDRQDLRAAQNITNLYLDIVKLEDENKLVDGANQRPHYSLRTLTRTLSYVLEITPLYGLRRSLFEGFSMSFLTLLDRKSAESVSTLINKHILPQDKQERKALMSRRSKAPSDGREYVQFEHYWLRKGPLPVGTNPRYIITRFIRSNLLNLVRAASSRKFPVLLQGPTSSGKTSMVEYLAKISGNSFVRINNHEHTDLQEYLGTYITDDAGNLRFQEGLLVQALRQGHWIVLDELNLAPTEILEALNRLLDDNRELFIPETQEVVRPHENFMLFATQNPAGLYGGRKALSRAFRNRFLELHFDDIPENELEEILEQRTQIAPSHAKLIIQIYRKLAELRQSSKLFEQKGSFATLRDLFRWALRNVTSKEELALHGHMLLAERVRNQEEYEAVRKTIQEITKIKIKPEELYNSLAANITSNGNYAQSIVWTPSMRRIYALVTEALKRNEPVLLVGGTGCGKTSVCQVIASMAGTQLHIVNAHQNTETGDLIGAQRPIRNKSGVETGLRTSLLSILEALGYSSFAEASVETLIAKFQSLDADSLQSVHADILKAARSSLAKHKALFEWSDGSLVHAMKEGTHFLLDEISLAEDSVLERLNSVLEPGRTLLLAEKGPDNSLITASEGFQFLATMNPGGDFGKRELSPALRNRFTEIWVPPMSSEEEIVLIAHSKLNGNVKSLAELMVKFSSWFGNRFNPNGPTLSIRDVLTWVDFANICSSLEAHEIMVEGAAMVYIDGLGANPAAGVSLTHAAIKAAKAESLQYLGALLKSDVSRIYLASRQISVNQAAIQIGSFHLKRKEDSLPDESFSLRAPTTVVNMTRVVRALQLKKPILLEGNPGVGKTTLVSALARAVGAPLTRINLSEQTDLMDLFGSDVPVEGGGAGQFAWRDAPFLQAMKRGQWVLLDEMNLASQSVLEGLNACLDHRGEVFIPELDQTFARHPEFTIFAAQNPHSQGGGRKGLPASFVNRFTVVFADAFDLEDLRIICKDRYTDLPDHILQHVINTVVKLSELAQSSATVAASGGPWEFNLRDILRWLELVSTNGSPTSFAETEYFQRLLFEQRFRSRDAVTQVANKLAPHNSAARSIYRNLSPAMYQAGLALLPRSQTVAYSAQTPPPTNMPILESIMIGVSQRWPVLLVDPSGSGKTSILRHLASMIGQELLELPLSADMDTMDIVGGYEQADPQRLVGDLKAALEQNLRSALISHNLDADLGAWNLLGNSSSEQLDLGEVESLLTAMTSGPCDAVWRDLLGQCTRIKERACQDLRARFEWADGILVRALETGKWLILDNANLCSSSVLDRLNSLLEPNGFLAVNEHKMPDGSARIVVPHSNFRLFLTMDPRHGELSRAMRNRCLELFVPLENAHADSKHASEITDSSLFRFEPLIKQSWSQIDQGLIEPLLSVSFDHLASCDTRMFDSLPSQISQGLSPTAQSSSEFPLSMIQAHSTSAQEVTVLSQAILEFHRGCFSALALTDANQLAQNESLNPLNNSMLLSVGLHSKMISTQPNMLGALTSNLFVVRHLWVQLDALRNSLMLRKVAPSSRLDRSIMSGSYLDFAKDDTAPLSDVLQECILSFGNWLALQNGDGLEQDDLAVVKTMLAFLRDLFHLCSAVDFDDATFQAYLAIGYRTLTTEVSSSSLKQLFHVLKSQLSRFSSRWQLQTGHGMNYIWTALRPRTPSNSYQQETLHRLEDCMSAMKELLVGTEMPYQSLVEIQSQMSDVRQQILDVDSDPHSIEQVMTSIEDFTATSASPNNTDKAHFLRSFQGLAQLIELHGNECTPPKTLRLAACQSIQSSIGSDNASQFTRTLNRIQQKTGLSLVESPLQAVRQMTIPTVMVQLDGMAKVSLASLQSLNNQLLELPRTLVEICKSRRRRPLESLQLEILRLHQQMPHILQPLLGFEYAQKYLAKLTTVTEGFDVGSSIALASIKENSRAEDSQAVRQVFDKFLRPSLEGLELSQRMQDFSQMAKQCIDFFVGCLLLYLPDRPYDPALQSTISIRTHRKRKQELESSANALSAYELMRGFEQSTPRIVDVAKELTKLGLEPPEPGVYRPEVSQLNALMGTFNYISKSILDPCTKIHPEDEKSLSSIAQNVDQAIKRLNSEYRDYDDVIQPAIELLRGLRIGIEFAVLSNHQRALIALSRGIRICTPTVDFSTENLTSARYQDVKKTRRNDPRVLFIHALATDRKVTGRLDTKSLAIVQQIFADFYRSWKDDLAKDQQEYATKSSLYRYRGVEQGEENTEEARQDMRRLFPNYEEEDNDGINQQSQPNDQASIAKRLADAHASLLNSNDGSEETFLNLVKLSTQELTAFFKSNDLSGCSNIPAQDLLPAALLMLQAQSQSLHADDSTTTRDFYRSSNLPEVNKLLKLVKRIQMRFRSIHEAWPEQASPIDVLKVIDELLTLAHTEPIAKVLTKTEQLHTFVYQWQQLASREFSASELYNELTNLIISWRRLELSSWATLLDVEDQNCDQDAKSWWFIAYETIIAASLSSLGSEEDFASHVQALIHTLTQFMKTTSIGQFRQRLLLLENFRLHLKALSSQQPGLRLLDDALMNFLGYYRRFQAPADEQLKIGRQALEKKMKEVILLSSWKDTNIEALRASSKASHVRLFKVIRKYRSVLAEPVEVILGQDAPFDAQSTKLNIVIPENPGPSIDSKLLAVLKKAFASQNLPPRFQDVESTVKLMQSHCRLPDGSIDVASHLMDWVDELVKESEKLQRETPRELTDENKPAIQQSKRLKRRLFANALKDLRMMGLATNIDTQTLSAQDSTAKLLTHLPIIENTDSGPVMDKEMFRIIDNLDKVRGLSRDHSDDLARNEVERSLVYYQGLVDLLMRQRRYLSRTASDLTRMTRISRAVQDLAASHCSNDLQVNSQKPHSADATSKWLPIILRFSTHLLKIHDQMGGEDTTSVQQGLEAFARDFELASTSLEKSQHSLPGSLTTKSQADALHEISSRVTKLKTALSSWEAESHRCTFATSLIRNWLSRAVSEKSFGNNKIADGVEVFVSQTPNLLDRLLKSLEKTSKILSTHPVDEEEPGWFLRSSDVLRGGLLALGLDGHVTAVDDRLSELSTFVHSSNSSAAIAASSFMQPFVSAYHLISKSLFERALNMHGATLRMTRILSDVFRGLLNNGFCGPQERSKGESSGQDKLEEGTGLGEGEGAEDISKDIEDDEDLSELAQSKQQEGNDDEVKGEDNAVDMADQELEGKMDEEGQEQDDDVKDDEDGEDDAGPEEELGDVGRDDPEAIDEKLWNGDQEENRSEEQEKGDQKAGKQTEEMAAQGDEKGEGEDAENESTSEEEGVEQGQEINDDNMPDVDPHLQEEEKLNLPEDMDMDGDLKSLADESDLEEVGEREENHDDDQGGEETDDQGNDEAMRENDDVSENMDNIDQLDGKDADVNLDEQEELENEQTDDQENLKENPLRDRDETAMDADDQIQGDTDGVAGSAENEQEVPEQQTETGGTAGQSGAKDDSLGAEESEESEQQIGSGASGEAASSEDSLQDSAEAQAFKKLGDALEKFQRSSKEIRQAQTSEKKNQEQADKDEAAEFEHLPDAENEADVQALGAADEDQAKGLDDGAMDLDEPAAETMEAEKVLLNGDEEDADDNEQQGSDPDAMDAEGPNSTAVGQRQANKQAPKDSEKTDDSNQASEEEIEELDGGLQDVHLQPQQDNIRSQRSAEDALQLWQQCELRTNDLAISLTEQLRLILSPTLATKMRGDFRTGKRLNIKRIIPYIASQYKRDKIWMRRSIPSKRNYQIMIAVDDSKSMNDPDSGSSKLAFETLALVSRSLSMLEVGQLCVLGFGEDVRVAHYFDQTFSSGAGATILQNFQFEQTKTDVKKLVSESLRLFREARAQSQSTNSDLWQLELIISDGICEDHEKIRQMIREAHQERIMIVFIIVDALKGTSITTLNQASFEKNAKGEMELRMKRYLADFPFDYYLIVGNVEELPAVLATALRQWFSEIADT